MRRTLPVAADPAKRRRTEGPVSEARSFHTTVRNIFFGDPVLCVSAGAALTSPEGGKKAVSQFMALNVELGIPVRMCAARDLVGANDLVCFAGVAELMCATACRLGAVGDGGQCPTAFVKYLLS